MSVTPRIVARVCPPTAILDDLELSRWHALDQAREVGPGLLVDVPLTGVTLPDQGSLLDGGDSDHEHSSHSDEFDAIEVTDPEGTPLATIALVWRDGAAHVSGIPIWQSPRSGRPFERFHLPPAEFEEPAAVTITLDLSDPGPRAGGGATDEARARLAATITEAGLSELVTQTLATHRGHSVAVEQSRQPRILILALASLDGDPHESELRGARIAAAVAQKHSAVDMAIAPLHAAAASRERKRQAIVEAYADQGAVIDASSHEWPAPESPATRTGRTLPASASTEPAGAARGSHGTVLFLTGLSGSGKSTLAREVRNHVLESGGRVTLLDGDLVRRHLSAGLGFSAKDRDTNIRRIGWVAAEIAHHGGLAICSPIAPFEQTRRDVQEMVESRGGRFVLVHVATPLEECERRDRKGLYARARSGEIPDFTGISSPYEEPRDPDLRLDTTGRDLIGPREEIVALLDT